MALGGGVWLRFCAPTTAWFASLVVTALIVPTAWAGDWVIAQEASGILLDGHLDVYAVMPEAQMGPLALLFAALPRTAYVIAVCAILPIVIDLASRDLRLSRRGTVFLTLGATALVAPGWSWFAVTGHADDALVVLGAAGMLAGAKRKGNVWLVAGFLVAIAAKPTAILLVPVLFLGGRRVVVTGLALAAAVWLPFFLADPAGFASAGGGIAPVWPGSLPDLVGAESWSTFPAWVRPVQLVGGWALIWYIARRHGVAVAIAAGFAFRALLEPGTNYSYSTPAIVFGLIADLEGRLRGGLLALLAFMSFAVSYTYPLTDIQGILRGVFLAAVVVVPLACASQPKLPLLSWRSEPRSADDDHSSRPPEHVDPAVAARRPPA